MSTNLINRLLEGIPDVATRIDVMATIGLFKEAYTRGKLDESKLRTYLLEIVTDVLIMKKPDLNPDALREEASRWVDIMVQVFKVERLKREAMSLHLAHE